MSRSPKHLPRDWRHRLPDPGHYYADHVDKLGQPNASGWAQGRCPFHKDNEPSLSVCLSGRGLWRCFGCGEHGDMVSFHERITGQPFKDAVRDLLGVPR